MKNLLCFWLLVICPFVLTAQYHWESLGNTGGVEYDQVYQGPDGTVLIRHYDRLFRLNEVNYHWEQLFDGNFEIGWTSNMASGPDGTVAWSMGSRLYRLSPGNSEAELLSEDLASRKLAVTPEGHILVYSDQGGSLFKVTSANTIEALPVAENLLPGFLVDIVNGSDNQFYFNSGLFLHRFDAVSLTWTEIYAGDHNSSVQKLHQSVGGDLYMLRRDSLFRSANMGEDWTLLPTPEDAEFHYISEGSEGKLYLSHNYLDEQHYTSTDGGQTWSVSDDILAAFTTSPSAFPLTGGNTLFHDFHSCGSYLRMHISDSNTYQSLNRGMDKAVVLSLTHIDPQILLAKQCNMGYQVSYDYGLSWDYFSVDDQPTSGLKVGRNSGYLDLSDENEILVSSELGGEWLPIVSTNNQEGWRINNFHLIDEQHILLLGSDGLTYYTSDGGQAWATVTTPDNVANLISHPSGYFFGYPSSSTVFNRVYRFDPTSLNWEFTPFPGATHELQRLFCHDDGTLAILAYTNTNEDRLFVSHNDGHTYENLPLPETTGFISSRGLAFNSEGYFFLATPEAIWMSTDHGTSWNLFDDLSNAPATPSSFLSIDKNDYLYFSGADRGLYRMRTPATNFGIISGQLWRDTNEDCQQQDANENAFAGRMVSATQGDMTFYASSDTEGRYMFRLAPGTYELDVIDDHPLYENCQMPLLVEALANEETVQNLAMQPEIYCSFLEITASTPFLRRCFDNTYQINICNDGTLPAENTQLNITLDDFFVFVNSSWPVAQQSGQSYLFDLGTLAVGECQNFTLTVTVSCDAVLGQEHCLSIFATPLNDCLPTLAPPAYLECQTNIGSYDPNDKRAFVDGKETTDYLIPETERLSYHIRFQNTGTDTAFTVVVKDELPAALDPASFRFEASSHPCEIDFTSGIDPANTIVHFTFHDLQLVDSTTNEPASHGFVKFSLAPKSDIVMGTLVANFADIYFDFNDPIRTNTSLLDYNFPVATRPVLPPTGLRVKAYPSPFSESVRLFIEDSPEPIHYCEWFNAQGQLIERLPVINNQIAWLAYGLPVGLYWYRLRGKTTILATGKVVKG